MEFRARAHGGGPSGPGDVPDGAMWATTPDDGNGWEAVLRRECPGCRRLTERPLACMTH